jgi:uncharacterized membrane protein
MKINFNKVKLVLSLLTALLIVMAAFPNLLVAQDEKIELILNLSPDHYPRELTPGTSNSFFLELRNNGDLPLTNIFISATAPEQWTIDLESDSIEYLSSGSVKLIEVDVTPPSDATRGSHEIVLIADTRETRAVTTAFVRVKRTFSHWLWIGIAVALIVIAGFVLVFIRSNR